jgi:hypothetical protein
MPSRPLIRLTRTRSALEEIQLVIERRHHTPNPTGKLDTFKKRIGTTTKNAWLVAKDEEEIKKLGEKLNRAVEDFQVCIAKWRDRTFLLI